MPSFRVPEDFTPHVSDALVRLRYLHPAVRASYVEGHVSWTQAPGGEPADVERELTYLLYRARIHAEGQAQRATLSRMAFGT